MNLGHNPELLDRLAANYALGTLKGGTRRRLEAYARQSATVRTSLLLWQERLCAMTELIAPMAPSANVWKRIENELTLEREAQRVLSDAPGIEALWHSRLQKLRTALRRWRGIALTGALATVAAVGVGLQSSRTLDAQVVQLSAQLENVQKLQYVAVLSDDKSAATALVTFDLSKSRLTVQRVGSYEEAQDKSLQLWALPTNGGPQSLGVLSADKVIRLTAQAEQISSIPMLAISLEPKGGVPSATGPTGPVLFKGALLKTSL